MDLSVTIVSWNVGPELAGCLSSIPGGATGLDYEIILIDNASTDGSAELVARDFPAVHLVRNSENRGFARASNQGIRASRGSHVLLLNCDTVIKEASLQRLVSFAESHPDAGVVGPRLLRPDGTPQPYCFGGDPALGYLFARGLNRILFHRYLHDWATDTVQQVDWVSGACLMVRRQAIEQAGLLDERFFMYFEDNDWCRRMRQAGWKVYYDPQVEIIHLGGQSLAKNPAARQAYGQSLRYFYAKHYSRLAGWALRAMLPFYQHMATI